MPSPLPLPASARSAAVVNEEIRALWAASGGVLSPSERARYEVLLVEWAAASRAGVPKAA